MSKFFANNITDDVIREKISKMCKGLYREEYANVVIFLTHHSKDPFILEEILNNAKELFSELHPLKFEDDIKTINKLLDKIPKLVLEDRSVKDYRERLLKSQDEIEFAEKENSNNNDIYDVEFQEEISELDFITKLNLAFKNIEIIGQILKNYYGSLKGDSKLDLGLEAYNVGLRSLNFFFSILESNIEPFVNDIKLFIEKKNLVEKDEIEEFSRKALFHFFYFISYAFIKKISNSIGSEDLSETFKEIKNKNNITSYKLIDISIKLDFFTAFPLDEIKKLKTKISNNILSYTILKRMVINYLYMFPTSVREKQKICNTLGIPMNIQRLIDKTSTQKKG